MRKTSGYVLTLVGLASFGMLGCNNSTGSTPTSGAATAAAVTNSTTQQDGGSLATKPLRCAPSEGMVDACAGKTSGVACTLSGKRDGGWSLPGSCRATFDGTGLACVPTPPGPPSFLVTACSGKAAGGVCSATTPNGRTINGTCKTGKASASLFCGPTHTPPAALVDACTGLAAGDSCSRPDHRDAGSKPGVCRAGPSGGLACRPATFPGVEACAGLAAGAACTLGHKHGGEGLSGSCVVPASGGAASCLVSCTELFRERHHHHHGFGGRGGPGGGSWWKHRAADAGSP
jgi:hypothetical protein